MCFYGEINSHNFIISSLTFSTNIWFVFIAINCRYQELGIYKPCNSPYGTWCTRVIRIKYFVGTEIFMMLGNYWQKISAQRISWCLKFVFRDIASVWQNLWTARKKRRATQESLLCDGIHKCKYCLPTNNVYSWRQPCPGGIVHADPFKQNTVKFMLAGVGVKR